MNGPQWATPSLDWEKVNDDNFTLILNWKLFQLTREYDDVMDREIFLPKGKKLLDAVEK